RHTSGATGATAVPNPTRSADRDGTRAGGGSVPALDRTVLPVFRVRTRSHANVIPVPARTRLLTTTARRCPPSRG
ncbi:MAG: hypothetical protein KIT69_17810, partial [Propionibacteriaceae bacterium]|nr:hypothetical protein [Propionibacteriaceae bacterium]